MKYCEHCGLADDITERCTKAEDEVRHLIAAIKLALRVDSIIEDGIFKSQEMILSEAIEDIK